MYVDYQNNEIHLNSDEWVTVILSDSAEVTVKGDGSIFTDAGKEWHA